MLILFHNPCTGIWLPGCNNVTMSSVCLDEATLGLQHVGYWIAMYPALVRRLFRKIHFVMEIISSMSEKKHHHDPLSFSHKDPTEYSVKFFRIKNSVIILQFWLSFFPSLYYLKQSASKEWFIFSYTKFIVDSLFLTDPIHLSHSGFYVK